MWTPNCSTNTPESSLSLSMQSISVDSRISGERYQDRGRYRQAAAVYRGLVAGIDDNIELVDGAYDHYARVFRDGLDAYVECVTAADLSSTEYDAYEQFLVERIESGSHIHREQFERALSNLQAAIEG